MDKIVNLEDVCKNQTSYDRRFKATFPVSRPLLISLIFNPTVGEY